jgi:DNA ligase (NAD+)
MYAIPIIGVSFICCAVFLNMIRSVRCFRSSTQYYYSYWHHHPKKKLFFPSRNPMLFQSNRHRRLLQLSTATHQMEDTTHAASVNTNPEFVDSPAFVVLHYYKDKVETSELPGQYTVQRSFVAHPAFRGFSTTSNSKKEKATGVLDAEIEGIEPTAPSETETKDVQLSMEKEPIYQELKSIAELIRQQDELYYNHQLPAPNGLPNSKNVSNVGQGPSGYIQLQPVVQPISDNEYDSLCILEERLCQQYPDLYERLQKESPWGTLATRYNGRVGMRVEEEEEEEEDAPKKNPTEKALTRIKDNEVERILGPAKTQARPKRTHIRPMLSLDNCHDTPQLLAWLERIRKKIMQARLNDIVDLEDTVGDDDDDVVETSMPITFTIVTEPKLDGLSLSLRYQLRNDKQTYQLQYAATRGDGRKGLDVTYAVRDGLSIPVHLKVPEQAPPNVHSTQSDQYYYWPQMLEIRGEIVLPQSVFAQLQEESLRNGTNMPFSNARNAASGILLRKEPTENAKPRTAEQEEEDRATAALQSQLRFYAYDLVVEDPTDVAAVTPVGASVRELLRTLGFTVPQPSVHTLLTVPSSSTLEESEKWTEADIPKMLQYYDALQKHREALTSNSTVTKKSPYEWGDYDMDGCVHKIADESLRTLLGASNRAPRWAVAHKFPPTVTITELLNIEIQVGRTGALTPVAILKPVDLSGVLVQRATMHNFLHMQQLLHSTDRVVNGTKVMIRRAGDVIPQVVSRVYPPTEAEQLLCELDPAKCISIQVPTHCPACGSVAISDQRNASSSAVGTVLRCSGPPLLCPPRAVAAMQHAFARDALDIVGLSEARIEQLMDAGLLQIPSDLFELVQDESKLEELADLPGWGPKSIQNLVSNAQVVAKDGVSLARFIYSLGIRGSGQHSSALIASIYGNIDAFLSDLKDVYRSFETVKSEIVDIEDEQYLGFRRLQEDSDRTKGIGPILIAALHDFSKQKILVDAAQQLAKCIKVLNDDSFRHEMDASNSMKERPLSGLSVVFTGSISDLSRSEAQKLAKEMGAKSTPAAISKSTGLVVTGTGGGKKLDQATKWGLRIIDATEFMEMVEKFRGER